jgi:hypothetical protein
VTRVSELIPGQIVDNGGMSALFICQAPHPLYPALRLVVWQLAGSGRYSFDALDARQDVGQARPDDYHARRLRLAAALQGGDQP